MAKILGFYKSCCYNATSKMTPFTKEYPMGDEIKDNIVNMLNNIAKHRNKALLPASHTTLLAASKRQDSDKILQAIESGISCFGENQVQEAVSKWVDIKDDNPDISLHFIGPLQSNKVADAVKLFDMIQTIDREKIARALAKEMTKQMRHIPCLIQVNIGNEEQKSGIAVSEVPAFTKMCVGELGLEIKGYMCVPPADEPSAPYFALMQKIAREQGVSELSMGMSGDYETAIKFGATYVRIGTALFGSRN